MTAFDALVIYLWAIFYLLSIYVWVWIRGTRESKLSRMIRKLTREKNVEQNRARR